MSLYTKVTDQIISILEQGTVPWTRPWSKTAGRNTPCNAVSSRAYSGVNTILLWASATHGYPLPRFLTFGQARRLGGSVRAGEKGFKIYFVKTVEKEDDKDKNFTMLREYTVFNVSQCVDLPEHIINPTPPQPLHHERRHELADEFLQLTNATVREGAGEAYYNPGADFISLPGFQRFIGKDAFYNTAFHELIHWTGHKSRLARDLKNRFGTFAYAAEELVAELGAAYLCAEFSFENKVRNAAYIQNWLQLLRADSRAIFTAASKAAKAAAYLRDLALTEAQPQLEPA